MMRAGYEALVIASGRLGNLEKTVLYQLANCLVAGGALSDIKIDRVGAFYYLTSI